MGSVASGLEFAWSASAGCVSSSVVAEGGSAAARLGLLPSSLAECSSSTGSGLYHCS